MRRVGGLGQNVRGRRYPEPVIASLTGTVQALGLDRVVLDVGGVGFCVLATPDTLAGLHVGAAAQLLISMLVREDSLTLYGFRTAAEREAFDIVRSITGIGPKTALALLATLQPEDLYAAVRSQDVKAVQRVPGIGAKIAGRVLLELGGRIPPTPADPGSSVVAAAPGDQAGEQVVEALMGLGYPAKTAEAAVAQVRSDLPAQEVDGDPDAAGLLRAALRLIGGKRV